VVSFRQDLDTFDIGGIVGHVISQDIFAVNDKRSAETKLNLPRRKSVEPHDIRYTASSLDRSLSCISLHF